mmetsp:Transcript_2526/g.8337  ORF Transcript_2526/g.8337 Transcript_2526/m.8337 type:complete len:231 (-) Transcript_2526:467-1159(-)
MSPSASSAWLWRCTMKGGGSASQGDSTFARPDPYGCCSHAWHQPRLHHQPAQGGPGQGAAAHQPQPALVGNPGRDCAGRCAADAHNPLQRRSHLLDGPCLRSQRPCRHEWRAAAALSGGADAQRVFVHSRGRRGEPGDGAHPAGNWDAASPLPHLRSVRLDEEPGSLVRVGARIWRRLYRHRPHDHGPLRRSVAHRRLAADLLGPPLSHGPWPRSVQRRVCCCPQVHHRR